MEKYAKIITQAAESRLDLPLHTIIFDNLFHGKYQVSGKKFNPLGFTIDPYYPDRTPESLEHHNLIVGNNCSDGYS